MKKLEFRLLTPEDIEVRVAQVTEKGCSLLLYKDARCDMNILDETVGAENWQNKFYEQKGILFCSLGINTNFANPELPERWIWKDDAGSESNTEAEKGNASDARKRAGFAFGIGRELYTSPFIWVKAKDVNIKKKDNGKLEVKDSFSVVSIGYDENRRIQNLVICNNKTIQTVFSMGADFPIMSADEGKEEYLCKSCGKPITSMNYKGQNKTAKECNDAFGGYCLDCYKKGKDNK